MKKSVAFLLFVCLFVCANAQTNTAYLTTGDIGLGTLSPNAKLEVRASPEVGRAQLVISNADMGALARARMDLNTAYGFATMFLESNASATGPNDMVIGNWTPSGAMRFFTADAERFRITSNGNMGIGTTNPGAYKLAVNGDIRARKIRVEASPWPDYVFNTNYKLRNLENLASYIKTNKHLPDIPSAKEVAENGINISENQALLLKKIEEMTLYIIAISKEVNELKSENNRIRKRLSSCVRRKN